MLRTSGLAAVASALLALAPGGAAGSIPSPGRYTGATGDGHVFEFTVERSRKAASHRKVTHFYLVYDIAGCRSGPIRSVFFSLVSRSGRFSRVLTASNKAQLSLTGRFTSPTRASGSFRVGVAGKCPLSSTSPRLSFHVKRR